MKRNLGGCSFCKPDGGGLIASWQVVLGRLISGIFRDVPSSRSPSHYCQIGEQSTVAILSDADRLGPSCTGSVCKASSATCIHPNHCLLFPSYLSTSHCGSTGARLSTRNRLWSLRKLKYCLERSHECHISVSQV